jgi:hypothetical protein
MTNKEMALVLDSLANDARRDVIFDTEERDALRAGAAALRELRELREQLAEARTQIDELRNVVQVAAFALAKREPEPETYTIGGSSE